MVTDLLRELTAFSTGSLVQGESSNGAQIPYQPLASKTVGRVERSKSYPRIQISESTTVTFSALEEGNWALVSGKSQSNGDGW